MPHFGILQDDGVYFIDGKSLAQGSGYRILSLPAQPYETRYPPTVYCNPQFLDPRSET